MNTSNFSKRKEGCRKNRIFKMFCETSSLKCIMFQLSYCMRFLVLKIKPEAFMIPLNFPMFPNNVTLRSSLSDLSFPFWNQCWSLQFDWLSTERFNYDFFPLNRIVFPAEEITELTQIKTCIWLIAMQSIHEKHHFVTMDWFFSSSEKDNLPLDR